MSEHNESERLDPDEQLPAELSELEQELRMLEPVAPDLSSDRILDSALTAQSAAIVSRTEPNWLSGRSALVSTALLSSGLTAMLMLALGPQPRVVERIRVVEVPAAAPTQARPAQPEEDTVASTDKPDSETVVWTPISSRAAELQLWDRVLQADADPTTPVSTMGPTTDQSPSPNDSPSFMRLRRMLNES